MKNRLLTIKQGGITQLLADELASAPKVEGLTLTPFGMSGILWFGFVYLAGTTVALMFAVRIDAKRNDYHRVMLDWKQDGGSSSDPYKIISKSLAFPHFWIILKLDEKFGKNKEAILREMNLAEEGETLSELFKQIEALPAGRQRDDLKAMLDELRGGIDEQVANYLGSDRDYKQMEASALAERISTTARAISDRLEARNASRRELEQGSSDSLQAVMDEIERSSGANKPDAIRERRQR
jgi:hypothetical protein